MNERYMKFDCPNCGANLNFSAPVRVEEKIVKEKCQCGMGSDYRHWRMALVTAMVVAVFGFLAMTSCEYIELEKIKAIKDHQKFDVKTSFNNGKLIVVPCEEGKK